MSANTQTCRPRRPSEADLTPEQRAKVEAIRARRRAPEARAEDERVRAAYADKPSIAALVQRGDLPPGVLGAGQVRKDLQRAITTLRTAREAQGLSLADVSDRSGLDRAVISRLENAHNLNPKLDTIGRYAGALGLELRLTVAEAMPGE